MMQSGPIIQACWKFAQNANGLWLTAEWMYTSTKATRVTKLIFFQRVLLLHDFIRIFI